MIRSKTEFHTELKAHRILDPIECPYIIQLYESVQLSELRGLIVTHFYNTFDYKVLRPFAKLVVYQLLQVHINYRLRVMLSVNLLVLFSIHLQRFALSTQIHYFHLGAQSLSRPRRISQRRQARQHCVLVGRR